VDSWSHKVGHANYVTRCGQPEPPTSYAQTNCRAKQLKAVINCSSLWTSGTTTPDIQTKSLIQQLQATVLYTVTHCGQPEPPSPYIQTKCRAEQLKAVLNCKTVLTAGATNSVIQTVLWTAGSNYILHTNQLSC